MKKLLNKQELINFLRTETMNLFIVNSVIKRKLMNNFGFQRINCLVVKNGQNHWGRKDETWLDG